MTGVEKDEGPLVRALTALAEHGIPTDVQELLLRGDPARGIAPSALKIALASAHRAIMGEAERLARLVRLHEERDAPTDEELARDIPAVDQCGAETALAFARDRM